MIFKCLNPLNRQSICQKLVRESITVITTNALLDISWDISLYL